jgi:coatomer protein complex subunit epsilon
LLVQLLLSLDRRDLALTTYQAAKRIGNDSTLVQQMEAWVGLKTVRVSFISPVPFRLACKRLLVLRMHHHRATRRQRPPQTQNWHSQGSRALHQSYYFYEELYQLPSGRTGSIFASHAASHLLLGHIDEAKADIDEALQRDGGDKDAEVLAVGTSLGMEGLAAWVDGLELWASSIGALLAIALVSLVLGTVLTN